MQIQTDNHNKEKINIRSEIAKSNRRAKMKNVEMTIEENILTIKVDLTKDFGPSTSGKTIIIASSEGNQSIPGKEAVKIGLNVYKKK